MLVVLLLWFLVRVVASGYYVLLACLVMVDSVQVVLPFMVITLDKSNREYQTDVWRYEIYLRAFSLICHEW